MKFPIYSYRDVKVGFGTPMIDQSDPVAVRGFSYAINSKEGIMNFASSDFDLYRIGMFDSETGLIESESVPILVVSGSSVAGV